jgi:hypothetical protein
MTPIGGHFSISIHMRRFAHEQSLLERLLDPGRASS